MNRFQIALVGLLVVLNAGCVQVKGADQVDPKEKELASLPTGIEVTHSPNPVKAQRAGRSGRPFTWLYKTTVKSTGGAVTIQEFGAFVWHDGHWVFGTFTGKPFTQKDFAEWYSCPEAKLETGKEYSDPQNWSGSNKLRAVKTKWYYIGLNEKGERVKGEAVTEELAEVTEESE